MTVPSLVPVANRALQGPSPARPTARTPSEAPELVTGALGDRQTALGAIALALDETDWHPQRVPREVRT